MVHLIIGEWVILGSMLICNISPLAVFLYAYALHILLNWFEFFPMLEQVSWGHAVPICFICFNMRGIYPGVCPDYRQGCWRMTRHKSLRLQRRRWLINHLCLDIHPRGRWLICYTIQVNGTYSKKRENTYIFFAALELVYLMLPAFPLLRDLFRWFSRRFHEQKPNTACTYNCRTYAPRPWN